MREDQTRSHGPDATLFGPVGLLGLLCSVALIYLGTDCAAQAQLQLVTLIAAGRIDSPFTERLTAAEVRLLPYEQLYISTNAASR